MPSSSHASSARTGRSRVEAPVGAARIELQHPVPDDLQRHAADLGRLCARRPIVDRGERQQASQTSWGSFFCSVITAPPCSHQGCSEKENVGGHVDRLIAICGEPMRWPLAQASPNGVRREAALCPRLSRSRGLCPLPATRKPVSSRQRTGACAASAAICAATALRPAPHPRRFQTGTQGPHHGRHGRHQPASRRPHLVL